MSGLKANTGAMSDNGTQTVNLSEELQDELDNLAKNVDSLMSIWKGIAAGAFNVSYVAQNVNFEAFKELLTELGERIGVAARGLNDTEENSANAGKRMFNA